jgi:hypothetical protein
MMRQKAIATPRPPGTEGGGVYDKVGRVVTMERTQGTGLERKYSQAPSQQAGKQSELPDLFFLPPSNPSKPEGRRAISRGQLAEDKRRGVDMREESVCPIHLDIIYSLLSMVSNK